ncbi:thioesterase-like superfamily-domain-containing protein [Aspergillus pseudocaelatus]|uniref:Thioesterase-like superfamily-domain-containing protein n=1 Tax=Aspergillus pseudocaelatus TaxID=1825620 RepID=A0ABQ6W6I7_9EURO|nr:thioesterase-like superfamily-domain-containing protein [Aspergillus pseudocaelatus]
MSPKDIPISASSVVSDRQPQTCRLTPLEDAIKLTASENEDSCFLGYLPEDWCTNGDLGLQAYGGFCTALIVSGGGKYFGSKHPRSNQAHCVSLHIQFLRPLPCGPFKISFEDIRKGSRFSVIEAKLCPRETAVSSPYILSIITLGNLHRRTGPSISLQPKPIPNRLKDCVPWKHDYFDPNINPPGARFKFLVPKGGPTPLWSPARGQNARDQWAKVAGENETFNMEYLGLLADSVPALPMNYDPQGLKATETWAFPTVSLSLDIREDPTGKEWVLVRSRMRSLRNGRFDMEMQMLDESNNLLANCRHSCIMLARRSGQERTVTTKATL